MSYNQGPNFKVPSPPNTIPEMTTPPPQNFVPQQTYTNSISPNTYIPGFSIQNPFPPFPNNLPTNNLPNTNPGFYIPNIPPIIPHSAGTNPALFPQNFGPMQMPYKEEAKYTSDKLICLQKGKFLEYLESNYNCKCQINGAKIVFTSQHNNLSQVKAEIEQKLKSLNFDEVGEWFYLDNSGLYVRYDPGISQIIEEAYKRCYLLLSNPSYTDYEEKVDFELNDRWYNCQFAKLGKPHLQMLKIENHHSIEDVSELLTENVEEYKFDHVTMRIIMRKSANEELKLHVLDYDWKWQHEDKSFRSYSYESNCIIEYGYKNYLNNRVYNQFIIIQGVNGIAYQINFQNMTQYNEKTRFRRGIQRDPLRN